MVAEGGSIGIAEKKRVEGGKKNELLGRRMVAEGGSTAMVAKKLVEGGKRKWKLWAGTSCCAWFWLLTCSLFTLSGCYIS